MTRFSGLAAAGAVAGLGMMAQAQPTITDLGVLPGTIESRSTGLSGDGQVVVGYCVVDYIGGDSKAFRWTSGGGLQDLGGLPGGAVSASGSDISSDGGVLVGTAGALGVAPRAWRWTSAGGMQSLGIMQGGTMSNAVGVSPNGLVVVGFGDAQGSNGLNRAWRWTSGGMQGLGTLSGGNISRAYAASADGSVVTGFSNGTGTGGFRAIRWTSAGGMQNLGTLPGGWSSEGRAISADGAVIVGVSSGTGFSQQAMRWTSAGGMQHLGVLPGGFYSDAAVVSADGSVVLGSSSGDGINNYHAVRWTAADGMVDLNAYLATKGVDLAGWELEYVGGISTDGTAIAGSGLFNGEPRAWLVSGLGTSACYANCDGSTGTPRLSANDFVCFINNFAAGAASANCDGSTGAPVLTGNDFVCFVNEYAAGCS